MPRARLFSLAAVVCLALLSTPVFAEEHLRTISTNGEATVYVVPDEVIVNVGVEVFDRDLDHAKAASDERGASLLKAIRGLGVEEKQIQTDTLNVEITYANRRSEVVGYTARRVYSVKLKDVKLFEKLTDVALKNGANQLLGFQFRTTELRKHRDAARKMAVNAAREKAVALAAELNCTIGKPRTITEGYGGGYWGGITGGNAFQNSIQMAPAGESGGDVLPLGQISVQATVSVTFDLE